MTWSRVLGSTTNTWTGRTKLIGIMILQYDLLESVLHLNSDSKTWNDDLRDSSRLQTEFNKSQSDRSHRQVKFFVCVEFEEVPTIHKAAYLPYAHNRQSSPSKIVLNLNQNLKATKAGFPASSFRGWCPLQSQGLSIEFRPPKTWGSQRHQESQV